MVESETAQEGLPPIRLLVRTKEGLHLERLSSGREAGPSLSPDERLGQPSGGDLVEFSRDGRLLAVVSMGAHTLRVVDVETGESLWSVEGRPVQALAFSPLGTYLLTWEKPSKEEAAAEEGVVRGNLVVWRASTGEALAGFSQKTFRKSDWPTVQWTPDEALAFKRTANEVQVHAGDGIGAAPTARLPAEKLGGFSLAPSSSPVRVATFFPESKGKPASVRIQQHPHLATTLAAKSFYKAQEAFLRWSPNGQAVLIHTHTDVDTSGASYYGSTGLYLVHGDGNYEATVPLPKEGPISDAQWAPSLPAQFVVIAGRMPAAATLYNVKGEPIFEFGQAHRNTISFSPHGRFVVLAGFGNLAGEVDFWDRNKQKLLGRNTSHCAVGFGWSPCGRWFMTATLAPRMNVDNAVKLFRYNGAGPLLTEEFENGALFDAQFAPAGSGVFPDRPASPTRKWEEAKAMPAPPPPKPKAVYRPPNSTGELAAMLRAEREAVSGPKKLSSAGGGAGSGVGVHQPYIPGMAPAQDPKAAKNKARKEKRKAAKAEGGADASADGTASTNGAAQTPAAPPPPPEAAAPKDLEKQLKALGKKLKQIEELKQRQAKGEALNEDQRGKLASEASIREQMAALKL